MKHPLVSRTVLVTIIVVMLAVLAINLAVLARLVWQQPATAVPTPTAGAAVSMTLIVKNDCPSCFNASRYQPEFESLGVAFKPVQTLAYGSNETAKLLTKYNISRLPAIILSKELSATAEIAQNWDRIGTIAPDGSYVMQGLNPPFFDIPSQRVQGLVNVLYLNDSSCAVCYDVTLHQQILARIDMAFGTVRVVDLSSSEGKDLVSRYNITLVPTILLRGDFLLYPGFEQIWPSVGTVESDGTGIFRSLDQLGLAYEDLSQNKVIIPAPVNATQ